MRRIVFLILIAAAALMAVGLICWRKVVLQSAKLAAIEEFAGQRPLLNTVPCASIMRIEPAADFTNMASVEIAGCVLSLPSDRFNHDPNPKRFNAILHSPRYRMLTMVGNDAKTWEPIMESVSQTNFYEFVRSVFKATAQDISKQPSMDALLRQAILLKAKCMMPPLGFEESCIEFDRGDLRGFIIGDPARTKSFYVLLYVPDRQQFIDLGIIQSVHLQMPDITELISLLKVKTSDGTPLDVATPAQLHTSRWAAHYE